jgi:glycosyltransferase involved in cell wall biosynthesis
VVHFHGFDAYDKPTLNSYGDSYRKLFEEAAAIIAVSRDMVARLRELGAAEQKIVYNPYGVDTELFRGARPADAPPVFLAAGRFVDKKAPHLTLLAFRRALEQCPEARLIMIGDGELLEACKQLARALGVADCVDFRGALPHEVVAAEMRAARGFVQHSLTATYGDSEGTPVAILEAGSSGLPVVSTRHGGIPEVVLDGITGYLVEEADVDGMASRIARLACDPVLAGGMGAEARLHIERNFPMQRQIAELAKILNSSAAGKGRHREIFDD